MRTTWAALFLTLAGAAVALAAPPESLPAPRAIEHGTMPVPAAPAPAAVAPDFDGHLLPPHTCNCGRQGCWKRLCAWLTYCPKPRGVNCYNCCEPLHPPLYTFFPPCVEGHGYTADCSACTSGHRAFQGRGGLGLGLGWGGCLGGCCGCAGRGALVAD
jgi:hypothetical protein